MKSSHQDYILTSSPVSTGSSHFSSVAAAVFVAFVFAAAAVPAP
jgi:hypothetical protein